jgi:hypothetical protein
MILVSNAVTCLGLGSNLTTNNICTHGNAYVTKLINIAE